MYRIVSCRSSSSVISTLLRKHGEKTAKKRLAPSRTLVTQCDGGDGFWKRLVPFGSKPIPPMQQEEETTTTAMTDTTNTSTTPVPEKTEIFTMEKTVPDKEPWWQNWISPGSKPIPPQQEQAIINHVPTDTSLLEASVVNSTGLLFEPKWWNLADHAISTVNLVHDKTDLSYGVTIAILTIGVRVCMFPFFVVAQRNTVRMSHMQPEMQKLQAQVKALGDKPDRDSQIRMGLQMQALFKKYNVNPIKSFAVPVLQIPIFMSMFFGLRKMPDYFPNELADGGLWWFVDLTQPDPYYILPAISALSFLAMIELGKEQMIANSPEQGPVMVNAMRVLGLVMVPATASFPTALFCYWCTNNCISFGQNVVFQNQAARKALGIWDPVKPIPGSPGAKGIVETLEDGMKRLQGKAELTEGEKISKHNKAVEMQKQEKKIVKGSRRSKRS